MSHLRLVLLLGPALMVPAGTPMAVYADSTSLSGYSHIKIKASQVVKFIRGSARATFNLKSTDKALKSWTCHSIRITAANILQAHIWPTPTSKLDFAGKAILSLYLRNSFYSADQHTAAMNISNISLPDLSTQDGQRYRDLDPHKIIFIYSKQVVPTGMI